MAPGLSEGAVHARALWMLVQAPEAGPEHTQAAWIPYGGGEAMVLAIVLLAVAGACIYAGRRLRAPLAIARPGRVTGAFMVAIWLLAIYTVLIATFVYGLQVKLAHPDFAPRHVRVGTFVDAAVTVPVIGYLTRRWGWKIALASAIIGTAAAPMIFELPFDLIVMARTNPPIPLHPMLYRQLFFLPLFLTELATLSLLALLPSMRLTANACYAVAAMFAVFAVWAAFGFAFPGERLPRTLNVISKMMCFVAAIMLFVWPAEPPVRSASAAPGG